MTNYIKKHTTLTLLVYTTKQYYMSTNICVDNTNNDMYDVTINVAHRKKTRKTIIWLLKQFKEIRTINVLP